MISKSHLTELVPEERMPWGGVALWWNVKAGLVYPKCLKTEHCRDVRGHYDYRGNGVYLCVTCRNRIDLKTNANFERLDLNENGWKSVYTRQFFAGWLNADYKDIQITVE